MPLYSQKSSPDAKDQDRDEDDIGKDPHLLYRKDISRRQHDHTCNSDSHPHLSRLWKFLSFRHIGFKERRRLLADKTDAEQKHGDELNCEKTCHRPQYCCQRQGKFMADDPPCRCLWLWPG